MTKRVLRSFLYLDENIVDDYLAQFEGGVLEGPYSTQDTTTGVKGGGAGIKAWVAEGNANVSSSSSSVVSQTIRETPVAKFTRLYDLLKIEDLIQPLNGFDAAVYGQIEPGEIVEVRGDAKLPQWEHLTKVISDFSGLIEVMKAVGQDPLVDDDSNQAYQGFSALIAKKAQEDTELIIAPLGSPKFKFVTKLVTSR